MKSFVMGIWQRVAMGGSAQNKPSVLVYPRSRRAGPCRVPHEMWPKARRNGRTLGRYWPALLVLVAPLMGACQKKDRLTGSTAFIEISPPATNVLSAGQKTFKAYIVNPDGKRELLDAEWSLSTSLLGTLSPQTGSEVTLTAGTTLGLAGTLQAAAQGLTGTAQVWIGSSGGSAATSYGFYTETLPNKMKFDIANPPDTDGGVIGAFNQTGNTLAISDGISAGEFTEGTKALKMTVTNNAGTAVAVYFSYGVPDAEDVGKDLSAFSAGNLKFDIRAPAGKVIYAKLEWVGNPTGFSISISPTYTTFDDAFHPVAIPLSSFTGADFSQLEGVTFSVEAIDAAGSYSFYIDNLRIEM